MTILNKKDKINKKIILLFLILIIIISLLLRIYYLDKESLWLDEGHSVSISKGSVSAIIDNINEDPHPPLYYFILHFWMKLFGDSEFSIRFPSVIFGILSIYVIFKLGELIFDSKIGLLGSFILSISTYHIRYSQEARSYSLLVLLVLLSNYYFIKILENKERIYIIGYIVSSIMMIYTHVFGLFYVIFQNIYYLVYRKIDIKLWIMIQGVILSFYSLWSYFFLRNIDTMVGENYVTLISNILPTFNSIHETFKIFLGSEQILYLFIIVIMIGSIIGIIKESNKKDIGKYIFIILWLFLPIVISIIISYTITPLYMNRYFIASSPALILLFSKGIFNLKKISIIFILLLIIIQIPITEGYYHNIRKDQWRDATNYIKDVEKDDDIILLYPNNTRIPFGYYYKNNSNYIGIDNSSDIKNYINNSTRIWLVLSHMQYSERKKELKLIEKELSKAHIKDDTIKFTGIKINLYLRNKK